MSVVKERIEIAAPIERVWGTIMDPARFGEWVTIHRSVSLLSDDPQAQGARMDQVLHMRGVSFKVHWRLVDVEAPNRAVWEGHGPTHSRAGISYHLSAGTDGQPTVFEYVNDFTVPGGRLGALASRFVVGHASEREAERSLARLKSLLERS
jgi:carbon monoxide dehydrogenase subunit G